ncbi:MAG TPA: helix-turn-helix domain-containing protein [Nitrososphaera sp.]|nr:helix-turn-helix domain-containing protein [Nitrososphaera sp.]
MTKLLTTSEAAERLGVNASRIRQLVLQGRLPAQKMGRDLFVDEKDLKLVEDRKPGRPSKAETAKAENRRKTRKRAQ